MSADPKDPTDEYEDGDDVLVDDPFAMFSEWSSDADQKAYADL